MAAHLPRPPEALRHPRATCQLRLGDWRAVRLWVRVCPSLGVFLIPLVEETTVHLPWCRTRGPEAPQTTQTPLRQEWPRPTKLPHVPTAVPSAWGGHNVLSRFTAEETETQKHREFEPRAQEHTAGAEKSQDLGPSHPARTTICTSGRVENCVPRRRLSWKP